MATTNPALGRHWPAGPPPRSTPEQLAELQARLTGTPPPAGRVEVTNAAFLAELVRGHPGRPWVTSFAEDPHKAPANAWRGKVAKSREAVPGGAGNAYFATATFAETATTRSKEGALSLLCVVLDDIGTDDLDDLPGPSWVTETSPHNHQAGYALAPGENPGEVAALLSALTGAGRKVADRSGNSIARYVRLPQGVNNKAAVVEDVGCPFPVRLARWQPAKRYKAEALADAFGVTPTRPQERTRDPDTDAELREAIVTCAAFHDPLVKLAARLVGRGMEAGEVQAVLQSLMTAAAGNLSTDARRRDWEARRAEIPRYVATAASKFRDPRAAPQGAGRIWTGGEGDPPKGRPAPRIITAAELGRMTFTEPRWAVPDLLPEGLALLAGRPKMGKSWLALAVGVAVASGGAALGRLPVRAGDALYLALEDRERRLRSRLDLLLDGAAFPERLHLATTWERGEVGVDALRAWLDAKADPRR